MKNLWNKLIVLLDSISRGAIYDFVAGVLIAAFFAITLDMGPWCIVPALFAGFIKEFFKNFCGGEFSFKGFSIVCLGGLVITLFAIV